MLEVEHYGSRYCKYLVWLHPGLYSGSGIHCPLELASDEWHGESDIESFSNWPMWKTLLGMVLNRKALKCHLGG